MAAATLEVILGPMFAGKTTLLIERAQELTATGARVVVARPAMDSRSAAGHIETHRSGKHAGGERPERWPAVSVRDAAGFVGVCGEAEWALLDEAHMLGERGGAACLELVGRGVHVVAAGVSLDHEGRAFAPLAELACHADVVRVVRARCMECGAPAQHSHRLGGSSERIVVGGAESYRALCRGCFTRARR